MPSKLPRYTLRIDPILLKKLSYIAEVNGRSANKEIEQIIKMYVANFEKKHGQIKIIEGESL